MIKAILVDDERPALRELDFLLKNYPEISIAGMYQDPFEAIEEIGRLKPQVVFLDINMPQLMGMDAASRILDASPDTDIVFVTAFDQYAVEAFELHALDYILKPVNPDRLEKTMGRIMKKKPAAGGGHRLQLRCLGRFQVAWEKKEPIKWRTEKTRELFAFLLHNEGRELSRDELLDRVWPEDNPEKSVRQLYNGIYYIRKTLREYGVDRKLINIDGNYSLRLGPVDFDVNRFSGLSDKAHGGTVEELEEMEALYNGDYLEMEDFHWAVFERERLLNLYLQSVIRLAQIYLESRRFDKAETVLIKGYGKNPYEETLSELLLKLYIIKGEKNKAVMHYISYSKLIDKELGVKPGEALQRLYQSVKQPK